MLNNYFTWRMAYRYAQQLSWEYVHANREFYVDRYGIPQFLGTWYYCFYNMDRNMGDALSSLYVKDHFADRNKQKVTYRSSSVLVLVHFWLWFGKWILLSGKNWNEYPFLKENIIVRWFLLICLRYRSWNLLTYFLIYVSLVQLYLFFMFP